MTTKVGKAQATILKALGYNPAEFDFFEANKLFDKLGIVVKSKRVGRKSVPVVSFKEWMSGGWNEGGDGDSYTEEFEKFDKSLIEEWIEK